MGVPPNPSPHPANPPQGPGFAFWNQTGGSSRAALPIFTNDNSKPHARRDGRRPRSAHAVTPCDHSIRRVLRELLVVAAEQPGPAPRLLSRNTAAQPALGRPAASHRNRERVGDARCCCEREGASYTPNIPPEGPLSRKNEKTV
jgi:hypothetical protein